MRKNWVLTQEAFSGLLGWLSPDQEEAAIKYEEIRKGLIRLFLFRGCYDPEVLADETFNRVGQKIHLSDSLRVDNKIQYFYGFANKIYLEQLSKNKNETFDPDQHSEASTVNPLPEDDRQDCLEECLARLSAQDRVLVLEYYMGDKSEKFAHRRKLAKKTGVSANGLRVKVLRIRKVLQKCLKQCLDEN